jgi:hypothetical protein
MERHFESGDAHDIERIHLAALTRRRRSSRPDQQHRSAGQPVALRRVADATHMQVARQDHIDVGANEIRPWPCRLGRQHCARLPPGRGVGCIERMVRDDNPGHILPATCQTLYPGVNLEPLDTTVLERYRARRVDSERPTSARKPPDRA